MYMTQMRALRKLRGYSQKKMQELTGIDRGNYSKIENGKRTMTLSQCIRISAALNTIIDYLLGRTDCPDPYPPAK